MNSAFQEYNNALPPEGKLICDRLLEIIDNQIPQTESKIRHSHPVWFIDRNPIVGYHKLKGCVRILFRSGQSFNEERLLPEWSFKAAGREYTNIDQIISSDLERRIHKAITIQWDYKNIVKRKGVLERLM